MAESTDYLDQVRELLRRAILTLAAIPDPDLRYRLGPQGCWPVFVQHARDAYGAAPPRFRTFQPTRRDLSVFLDVLKWLNWYARQGERNAEGVRLFLMWTFGAPLWRLQERCTTNRRQPASKTTVYDRMDAFVARVAVAFAGDAQKILLDVPLEVGQKPVPFSQAGEFPQTSLEDLPRSPRAVVNGDRVPQTAAEERAALKVLTGRLERNQSRALDRKQKAARR